MRQFQILVGLLFLTSSLFCEPQVTISLITDQGVKTSEFLTFSISGINNTLCNFTFDKFSEDGSYANTNLFQYNKQIGIGHYKMTVILKTDKNQILEDSLSIDATTSRIEIFVFLSTNDSTTDFVKEIKTLRYQTNSDFIKFYGRKKRKVGSNAVFGIKNIGNREIYGYPNSAFFFGTLYQEIGNNAWTQHYPTYINIKYCDTVAVSNPLAIGQKVKARTPDNKDCSEYKFTKKGNYYFALLYTTTNSNSQIIRGQTRFSTIDVYRQIFEFKL